MEILLSKNQKCFNSYIKVGHNLVQRRHSRQSVNKHKSLARIKREYLVDKKENLPSIESPLSLIDPNSGQYKTSITVDILGNETFPQLTDWRKNYLIAKTRRLLPLPISLTGLGDGEMPRFWTQVMRKAALRLTNQNESEMGLYEKIPLSVKFFIENFGEKVRNKWPEVYENYFKSKELYLNESKDKLTLNKNKVLQFPYEMISILKDKQNSLKKNDSDDKKDIPRLQSGSVDKEYEDYLKHHHLMQYFAASLKGISNDEYEAEIEGWRDQFWLRNYGTPDPSVEPSHVECSGCGARLHCTASNIPGYMPSEMFKQLNEKKLKEEKCQRCEYLSHFNVALNVNVKSDEYPELIAQIRKDTKASVIIMIDLLDFPCSVWPGIVNLIGTDHKVYIVGNKVDLLPKDNELYLERALFSLKKSLQAIGIDRSSRVIDVSLISAKTGWGVEQLITKLMRDRRKGEDLYLIGCTNVGKSTLFNALMQSDLCKLRDVDLISRATTSLWPGTTLSLIKFPVREPTGWELQMRINRLKYLQRNDVEEWNLKKSLYRKTGDSRYAALSQRIGMTFRTEIPFTVGSGHPFARKPQSPKPFDPQSRYFEDCDFFCDTPGTIYKDQILTLLTTEELLRTIPREIITPRTFTLRPLQSLFIGGLARIDLTAARQQVWFTVFASHYLPIHVVYTEEANRFYRTYLGTDMLGVPIGGEERIKYWPQLVPKEIELQSINWNESCADIVLSSAGWVAVTSGPDTKCVLRAFTPEGRGIFVRNPPLLPYAFNLRGKRILGTPCFENKLFTIDDLKTRLGPKKIGYKEDSNQLKQKRSQRMKN